MDVSRNLTPGRIAALVGLGLVAGLFSGLFGVGGGMIVVPGLVVVLRVEHKIAVGTSLMAIIPAATMSVISYAVQGTLDNFLAFLAIGLVLAVGAVVGAQLGAKLLAILSRRAAQWVFVVFVLVMIVFLVIGHPNRDDLMHWSVLSVVGLVALGLFAGVASGLLGIGGGAVVVPIMIFALPLSDLLAKGASLVMMLPGSLSGLVGHLRGHRVLVKAGLIIGLVAMVTGPLGSWISHALSADVGKYLFACYLAFVAIMMIREALRKDVPKPAPAVADGPETILEEIAEGAQLSAGVDPEAQPADVDVNTTPASGPPADVPDHEDK